jgi:alpha-ketoglutaric semialdehyde dehydrogenase
MASPLFPALIPNWIDGRECPAGNHETFIKHSPANGLAIATVARSRIGDINQAVESAAAAFSGWATLTPVRRGEILLAVTRELHRRREEIAAIVAAETGMSFQAALGETGGAIALGEFMAGEGRRLYGRTTTSAVPNKMAMTVREPLGIAGLIIAANTPIANVAWKVFPALVCGNTAVLKAAEDTPGTAWFFGVLSQDAGLPPGVLNIVHGYGEEAGAPLGLTGRTRAASGWETKPEWTARPKFSSRRSAAQLGCYSRITTSFLT